MGSGKGAVDFWVAVVKPGMIIFEISGLNSAMSYDVLNLASYKLPIKLNIVNHS
jgi:large subunit ribosomal protein L16